MLAEALMPDGISYDPKELFDRLDARFDKLDAQLDAQGESLRKEISEVRHRAANLAQVDSLTDLRLIDLGKETAALAATQAAFQAETRRMFEEFGKALDPMKTFLNEQAGVEKWKKRFLGAAAVCIAAITGLTAFFVGRL